jgi:hypothetical protein
MWLLRTQGDAASVQNGVTVKARTPDKKESHWRLTTNHARFCHVFNHGEINMKLHAGRNKQLILLDP